jgi:hypothetical protein
MLSSLNKGLKKQMISVKEANLLPKRAVGEDLVKYIL